MTSVAYLFTRLVNVGTFPSSPPTISSQPSFFSSVLPTIRSRLSNSPNSSAYSDYWCELLNSLTLSMTVQSMVSSLFGHITPIEPGIASSPHTRSIVKREAGLLRGIIGPLDATNELWDNILAVILGRGWSEGHARIFACWSAIPKNSTSRKDGETHNSLHGPFLLTMKSIPKAFPIYCTGLLMFGLRLNTSSIHSCLVIDVS